MRFSIVQGEQLRIQEELTPRLIHGLFPLEGMVPELYADFPEELRLYQQEGYRVVGAVACAPGTKVRCALEQIGWGSELPGSKWLRGPYPQPQEVSGILLSGLGLYERYK